MSWGGFDGRLYANRQKDTYLHGLLDVSGRLFVTKGDVSFNGSLYVANNVGIGKTNPAVPLDVVGNINTTGNLLIGYDATITGNATISGNLTVNGNLTAVKIANKYIVNTTTSNYQLIVSNDLSLNGRLFVGRNVGIGTTNPLYGLDIQTAAGNAALNVKVGDANALSVTNAGKVAINTSASYAWPLTILANTNTTTGGNLICNSTADSGGLIDFQGRAPFVILDNVYNSANGIGLKMGIWRDSGSAYIQCEAGNTGYRNICMQTYGGNVGIGKTNPSVALDIQTAAGNAALNVKVGTTNALSVITNGNVGIGITNPAYLLDVSGGTGTKIHDLYINSQVGMAIGSIGIKTAGNFSSGFALYQGTGGDTVLNAYSGQPIDFKINNVTKMKMDSNGNVGIGKTDPSVALDVNGKIRIYETTGTVGSGVGGGSLTLQHANDGGTSSIVFKSQSDSTDYGYITFQSDAGNVPGRQRGLLCIGTEDNIGDEYYADRVALQKNGGYVGIGTTTPQQHLDVNGIIRVYNATNDVMGLFNPSAGNYLKIGSWNTAGNASKNIALNVDGGYVGIGKTNPTVNLDVGTTASDGVKMAITGNTKSFLRFNRAADYFYIGPDANNNFCIFNQGETGVYLASGQTSWTIYSDFRLKKNMSYFESCLNKINKLRPVWFQWKNQDENDQHMHPGFIAQEVEPFIPELIAENYSEKYGFNLKGITITDMIPFIVKAMQEQQQIIESLQTENQDLKLQMSDILSRLSSLENK